MSHVLEGVAARIRDQAAAYCEATQVPGYLAGFYHDGRQAVVATGWPTRSPGCRCVRTLASFSGP